MNKQIDLNDVVHAILRGMMDQHPSEITIGDFKLNCFYIASAAGKKHLAPTFPVSYTHLTLPTKA